MTLAQQISVAQRAFEGGAFPVDDWQRAWWRETDFWRKAGDGVYIAEEKFPLMWEVVEAVESLLGERAEDRLALMRTALFGQPYDVDHHENLFWNESAEFFWSQP